MLDSKYEWLINSGVDSTLLLTPSEHITLLNALGHFAAPAAAPVVLNVVWIAALLWVCPYFGDTPSERIVGLAWGILGAGALQFAIQITVLARNGIRLRRARAWHDRKVREVLQIMKSADQGISENDYLRVVFHKTASLIAAASETGAVLAGADSSLRKRMFEYGKEGVIAFQLVDDVLDYIGSEKDLGKRPLQDLREGKITLPLIHALREAGDGDQRKTGEILDRRRFSDREISFLAKMVARNGGLEYTKRRAKSFVGRGKRHLAFLPSSPARDGLTSLSDYIVSRTH
ncbi:MAG: hypothetical protein E4H29_05015 [Deltaproteobacteria bacterium]|nr:MAG: hypothetical protein E4H29_05015 [Deltaproteobacteria bacterium]